MADNGEKENKEINEMNSDLDNLSGNDGLASGSDAIPFGYQLTDSPEEGLKVVIHPEEAEIVREIFRAYASGRGCELTY